MTDLPPEPDRGYGVKALDLLKARLLSVALLLVLTVVSVTYFGGIWSPPRWLWLALFTALFAQFIAIPAGLYCRSIVGSTDWYFLVDLDATTEDMAIYQMPHRYISNYEVLDGQLDNPAPRIYIGREIDPEEKTAVGTWRGTFTDRQLLATLQAVRQCRNQLEEDARVGFALRNNLFSIVRSAVVRNTEVIVEAFEDGTLPERGDAIDKVIDETIDQFDPEESDTPLQDDLDLDSYDLDDLLELQKFKEQTRMNADDHIPEGEAPSSTDPLAYSSGGSDD